MVYEGIESKVTEQWTLSRAALVLGGPVAALIDVAERLNLPTESVIEIQRGEAMLGLWGEPLAAYQDLKSSEHIPLDPSPTN